MSSRPVQVARQVVVVCAALLAAAPAAGAATIAERVQAAHRASGVASTSSVFVWKQSSRDVLVASGAGRSVTPASTIKLLTSAAALEQFGPTHRFSTRLLLTGRQEGSTWIGSAWLEGGGDPSLSTATFARQNTGGYGADITVLADALAVRGITTVQGRLLVDDDHLDSARWVAEWPTRFRFEETGALGALTVNQSLLGRFVGSTSSREPALRAGLVLRGLLAQRGVTVTGGVGAGDVPADATEVATLRSPTLSTLVRHMNRASDNFYAELLLKHVGRARFGPGYGTTTHGRRAARETLARLGVDVAPLRWLDGSGLAYGNRVTARVVGQTLGVGAQATWGAHWTNSFARSGGDGTLRRRMTTAPYRGRVRAKTGTLRHASGLAGFADRADGGGRYGFVVLTYRSDLRPVDLRAARRLQDRVAQSIVR